MLFEVWSKPPLARTNHEANMTSLRTVTLSLVYSTVEHCAPVWTHSAHSTNMGLQLNATMRIISCTLKSAPLPLGCSIYLTFHIRFLKRKKALKTEHAQ